MLRGSGMRALLAGLLLAWAGPAGAANQAAAQAPGAAWTAAHGEARRLLEELRSEVEAMKRIEAAQQQLGAWNEERARIGLAPATLRPELCLEKEIARWCRLLPATFGVAEDGR